MPVAVVELVMTGVTAGPAAELRGFGVAAAKSVELLPVSVAPAPARKMAVVVDGAGATAPS